VTQLATTSPSTSAARPDRTARVTAGAVCVLLAVTVLLEVSVMPYLRIADGIPDLVAPMVVAVAVLRGTMVGAITGFAAGLLIELTAPIGTLGAMALLYLAVGAWCGRYCERPESARLLAPLVLSVAAAGFVQVGYALFHLLLGIRIPASELVGQALIPTLALTALLSAPVVLTVRKLLGEARIMEPYGMAR
jgi:rod shape-determining protein MreD